jgi:hypothetical protein
LRLHPAQLCAVATEETCRRAYLFPVPCKFLTAIAFRPGASSLCRMERKRSTSRKSDAASQGRPSPFPAALPLRPCRLIPDARTRLETAPVPRLGMLAGVLARTPVPIDMLSRISPVGWIDPVSHAYDFGKPCSWRVQMTFYDEPNIVHGRSAACKDIMVKTENLAPNGG